MCILCSCWIEYFYRYISTLLKHSSCFGMFVNHPLNLYVETLTLNDAIWREGLWEVIGIQLSPEAGGLMIWLVLLSEVEEREITLSSPCEDSVRRWPSASQEKRASQNPTTLSPPAWTSILQNCDKINFWYLSHLVYCNNSRY